MSDFIFDQMQALQDFVKPYAPLPSSYAYVNPTTYLSPQQIDQLVERGEFSHCAELTSCLIICACFGVARWILQRIFFKPLAIYCQQLTLVEVESLNPVVDAYLDRKFRTINRNDIKKLCLAHKLPEIEVRRSVWNRNRNVVANKKITKFTEAAWRFIFYSTFLYVGYCAIFTPSRAIWSKDSDYFWKDWPYHNDEHMPSVRFFYALELGCYLHQLMWTEVTRSDAAEMIAHHLATIGLMVASYMGMLHRIGAVTLFIHDIADIFLESGKCFNYMAKSKKFSRWAQPVCDLCFGLFTVTFFVTRLIIFPYFCVYSLLFRSPLYFMKEGSSMMEIWPFYYWHGTLFTVLQCLHVFWFYLISRMIYKMFLSGTVEKDERESDEEDDLGEFDSKADEYAILSEFYSKKKKQK